jgi:hypothetical protein
MRTQVGDLVIYGLEFPDPAGALQREKATASLIREVGDNYGRYHAFLSAKLSEHGGRPDPEAYEKRIDDYLLACQEVRDVLVAEMLLRRCRVFRKLGGSLDTPLSFQETPLVDEWHRLVSAEIGRPLDSARPSPAAQSWEPPAPPDPIPPEKAETSP